MSVRRYVCLVLIGLGLAIIAGSITYSFTNYGPVSCWLMILILVISSLGTWRIFAEWEGWKQRHGKPQH